MRVKIDDIDGLRILSVRGKIEPKHLRMLLIGCDSMFQKPTAYLIFNFTRAELAETEIAAMATYKKAKDKTDFKGKVIWISKNKQFGEFLNTEIYFSRHSGSKFRQVAEKVKLDDHIDELYEAKHAAEQKLKAIIGDDDTSHLLAVTENQNLKIKKRILSEQIEFMKKRQLEMKPVAGVTEDVTTLLQTARDTLQETLQKTGFLNAGEKNPEL